MKSQLQKWQVTVCWRSTAAKEEKFLTVKAGSSEDRILGYLRKQIMVREIRRLPEFLEK